MPQGPEQDFLEARGKICLEPEPSLLGATFRAWVGVRVGGWLGGWMGERVGGWLVGWVREWTEAERNEKCTYYLASAALFCFLLPESSVICFLAHLLLLCALPLFFCVPKP